MFETRPLSFTSPERVRLRALASRIQAVLEKHRKNTLKIDDGPHRYAYVTGDATRSIVARGIIGIPTRGCSYARSSWMGCAVCGHNASSLWKAGISDSEVLDEFEKSITALGAKQPSELCLYTSGSFLDSTELPEAVRSQIISRVAKLGWVKSIVVESMPQFVQYDALKGINGALQGKQLTISMGLDSSNDLVRSVCFQRHITGERYRTAVAICRDLSIRSVAYLVHGVPFLAIQESIYDTATSIRDALESFGFDSVSVEPVAMQAGTIQELAKLINPNCLSPNFWSLTASLDAFAALSSMAPSEWAEKIVIGGQFFTPLPVDTVKACIRCLDSVTQKEGLSVAKVLLTLPLLDSCGKCCEVNRLTARKFSNSDLPKMVDSQLSCFELTALSP